MAINAKCPYCLNTYRFDDDRAGQPVRCEKPECNKLFKVPRLPANPPPNPVPSANGNGHVHAPAQQPASVSASVSTSSRTPPPMHPVSKGLAETPDPMSKVTSEVKVEKPKPPEKPEPPKTPPKSDIKPKPKEQVAQRAPKKTIDIDSVVSETLFDDEDKAGPSDAVPMTCEICEHKWTEPLEKQGKRTTCPECRHIQKVPELKDKDWRENHKPSLAKIDDVPDNVTATTQGTWVGRESLRQTGAIQEDIEPRPMWHYFAGGGTLLAMVLAIYLGIANIRHERGLNKERRFMDDSLAALSLPKESESDSEKGKPPAHQGSLAGPEAEVSPNELPLFRAMLRLAAGEYNVALALRENQADALEAARTSFHQCRQELMEAPKSPVRDALFGELVLAQLQLGGTPEQIEAQIRYRWDPEPPGSIRAGLRQGKLSNVQDELRQTLQAMGDTAKPLDRDTRYAIVRQLSRALQEQQPPQTRILELVVHLAFQDQEAYAQEAKAQIAAEMFRKGDLPGAMATLGPLTPSQPRTGMVLAYMQEPPLKGWRTVGRPDPSGKSNVDATARFTHSLKDRLQNKSDEALALATRPGGTMRDWLDLLLRHVEWSADPKPVLDAATKIATTAPKPKDPTKPPDSASLDHGPAASRLAIASAQHGHPDAVDLFLSAIHDDGLKAWTQAEVLRLKLKSDTNPHDATTVTTPEDTKKLLAGQAWSKLLIARHNTRISGNKDPKTYDDWNKILSPFGLAGLALGLQDYDRR